MDAGDVAARSGKACDKTCLDRVRANAEDDRNRRRRGLAVAATSVLLGVPMTATRRRTISAISAGRRSKWPSSQW